MNPQIFYPLLLLFCLASCKVPTFQVENFMESDNRIHFGEGGGFTGLVVEYVLLENGQLFSNVSSDTAYHELLPIERKEARAYFEQLESLRLLRYDFDYPGNRHYFLRAVNAYVDHTVRWGASDIAVREEVEEVHADLMELTDGRKRISSR